MANILLIEPNVILARTYAQALIHAGHAVVHAASAQDAIYAADTLMPDIVVMEMELAEHNGIEFLHEFRSYDEWRDVPVIINSYVSPAVLSGVEETLKQELGVKACLYKPRTTLDKLVSVVNQKVAATA